MPIMFTLSKRETRRESYPAVYQGHLQREEVATPDAPGGSPDESLGAREA